MSENKVVQVEENKCCFCHDECNPNSQACGRCMRSFVNGKTLTQRVNGPPNTPVSEPSKVKVRRHSSDNINHK